MFKIVPNPIVGALALWLALPALGQAQLSRAGSALTIATPDVVVVRTEVDDEQFHEIGGRFELVGMERVTRSRTVLLVAVDRSRFRELKALGLEPKIDEVATRAFVLNRERRSSEGRDGADTDGLVRRASSRSSGITNFPCYRTVEETYASLSTLASNYPDLATWIDVGDSLIKKDGGGGYDIGVLKVTDGNSPGPKAPFVIIAATHAREYVTAETATRFAEHLVQEFGVAPDVTAFLRHVEVWIMPVHNPDGRKVAEADATKWKRKNERDVGCSGISQGVDLNRNSEQYFRYDCMAAGECTSGLGFSTTECDSLYTGPDWPNGPENPEPETNAANDLMAMAFDEQWTPTPPDTTEGLFISIHSSGEYILFPWEARWNDPPNFEGLRTLGRRLGHRLEDHKVCQDCFGTASGTNVDEAYGRYGVASYTFELGDEFHQPCDDPGLDFENEIWPEARDALMLGLKSARRPYLEPGGPEIHSLPWLAATFQPGESLAISGIADDTRVDWNAGAVSGTDAAAQPEHNITGVYYSIGLPPWDPSAALVPLAASAGNAPYDASVESFAGSIDTSGLSGGKHVVWIVAEDDEHPGGQMGVASAVLIEADFLFADGFESGDAAAWSP